jgi:hypothetical protein
MLRQAKVKWTPHEDFLLGIYAEVLGLSRTEFLRRASRFYIYSILTHGLSRNISKALDKTIQKMGFDALVNKAMNEMEKRGFNNKQKEYVMDRIDDHLAKQIERYAPLLEKMIDETFEYAQEPFLRHLAPFVNNRPLGRPLKEKKPHRPKDEGTDVKTSLL